MEPIAVTMNQNIIEPTKVKKVKKVKKSSKSSVVSNETSTKSTKKSSSKGESKNESTIVENNVLESSETQSTPSKFVEELIYIPVPRVRKYINNNKVNKTIEDVLSYIKECQTKSLPLELSDEYKYAIGKYMDNKETNETKVDEENVKLKGEGKELKTYKKLSELSEYEIATSAISKLKYKFSNNSFQVISIILDRVVMEITELTIKNILLSKKTTLNPDFSVKNDYSNGELYALYKKSNTYMNLLESVNTPTESTESTETPTTTESSTDVSTDEKTINFRFHIRKIVNHIKHYNEDYKSIKISDKFCEFCSNVIFDILDRVINILMVLVDTIHNKTITKDLFISVFKIILVDTGVSDDIINKLFTTVTSVMSEVQTKKEEHSVTLKEKSS